MLDDLCADVVALRVGQEILCAVYSEAYGLSRQDTIEHLTEIQEQLDAEHRIRGDDEFGFD